MAATIKYLFASTTGNDFLDLSGAILPEYSLVGQEIAVGGSATVNTVRAGGLGVATNAVSLLAGEDVILFGGYWSDYTKDVSSVSGAIVFSRVVDGATETITVGSGTISLTKDRLVFADGAVRTDHANAALKTIGLNALTTDIGVNWDTTKTSVNPASVLPSSLGGTVKGLGLDAAGVVFAMPTPGISMILTGSSGVDEIYVTSGATVDAVKLLVGQDIIYFTGSWADYTKDITSTSGAIVFTRSVNGMTERVTVGNGAIALTKDKLVFADGAVLTHNAKAALLADASVTLAAITGYDPNTTTPGLTTLIPLTPETDTGTSNSDGVTANRKPMVSGTATPGSAFVLGVDLGNDGSVDLSYEAIADAQGVWTVDLATATPLSGSLPAAGLPYGETKLIAGSVSKVVKIQEFYISGVAWDEAGETVQVVLHSPQGITVTPASAQLGPTLKIKVGASERIAEFDQAATDAHGVDGELVFVYRANPWEVDMDGVEVVGMSFDARGATLQLADQSTLASIDHDGTAANAASAFRSDAVVSGGGRHDADNNGLDLDDVIVLDLGQVSAGDIVALGDGRNLVKLAEVGLGVAYTHNNDVSLGLRGTIDLSGIAGDVTVDFIEARLYMTSGGAADTIAGFNAIVSGQGNDAIHLSSGIAERLIYAGLNSGQDEIFGFMTGAGGDVIDLSAALDKFRDPAAPLTSDPLNGVSANETAGGVRIDVDGDRNGVVDFSLTLRDTSFAPSESAAQFVQRLVSDGNLHF